MPAGGGGAGAGQNAGNASGTGASAGAGGRPGSGGMPAGGTAGGGTGGAALGNTCEPGRHGLTGVLGDQVASSDDPTGFSSVEGDWWISDALGHGGVFYLAGSDWQLEQELAIEHAVFRWSDGEHADTFFCAGAGSSIRPSNEGSCVVLRNLTRLGKCSELAPGADAVSGEVGLTNSFSGTVDGQPYIRHSGGSRESLQQPNGSTSYRLSFAYPPSPEELSEYPKGFVSFRTAQPLGANAQPLLEPYIFEAAPGPPRIICGGPGSVGSAPSAGSTSFELQQATTLACPGEPIEGELEAVVNSSF